MAATEATKPRSSASHHTAVFSTLTVTCMDQLAPGSMVGACSRTAPLSTHTIAGNSSSAMSGSGALCVDQGFHTIVEGALRLSMPMMR